MRSLLRTDTSTGWASKNPVLAIGEMGYDSTNRIMKIGDGVTNWASLQGLGNSGGNEDMATICGNATPESTTVLKITDYTCIALPKVAILRLDGNLVADSTATAIKPVVIFFVPTATYGQPEKATTVSRSTAGKCQISQLNVTLENNNLTFTSTNALTFTTSDNYSYCLIY